MREKYYAKTHADFLNQKYGTNFVGYMHCTYTLSNKDVIWMVEINGRINKEKFCNTICDNGATIKEEYFGDNPLTLSRFVKTASGIRIAVNVHKETETREYEILGRYAYDIEASNITKCHYWRKI